MPLSITSRRGLTAVAAALVAGVTWFLRFNDPNGSFAGLTDDHFFYVVRGWQILYGDLPARDFVDHGAPLHFYVAAAVQFLFGRGTLSELAFSATMLACGAGLTFWLASRASGSIVAGLLGAAVHILLFPRFYNYPKVVVYAAAIPLLWWFADRPGRWPRFWLAATTVVAFLFRYDHGAYVAAATMVLLVLLRGASLRERVQHAAAYAGLTLALLTPYLLFLQFNGGGLVSHFEQAAAWADRERERTPIVWPGLFDYPDGVSDETKEASAFARPMWVVRDNATAWLYYLELVLPFVALAALAASRDGFRPGWAHARVKVAIVAVVALILDAGFLRSPLAARLADPSVPHAVLIAWLAVAVASTLRGAAASAAGRPRRMLLAGGMTLAVAPMAFVLASALTYNAYDRLESAGLTEGVRRTFEGASSVARTLRRDWQLETWEERPDRSELITLAMYLNACTPPDARVFVQPYIPQVLALSRRAFAGGHADLRSGFFDRAEDQRVTIERLRRQQVPLALLGEPPEDFTESFPFVGAYLTEHYDVAATHVFDGRFRIVLLVNKDAAASGQFAALDWPCLQ